MPPKRVVALTTTASTAATQQERALFLFRVHGIEVETVDAALQKDRRRDLLKISGLGAKYPQFFLQDDGGGTTTFLGDYNEIVDMNDAGMLSKEKLGLEDGGGANKAAEPAAPAVTAGSRDVAVPDDEEAPWLSHDGQNEKEDVCCFGLLPSWFKKPSAIKDA